jgi:hypothetical protein
MYEIQGIGPYGMFKISISQPGLEFFSDMDPSYQPVGYQLFYGSWFE